MGIYAQNIISALPTKQWEDRGYSEIHEKIIRTSNSWGSRSLNTDTMCRAILQYRNTPSRKDGRSPAQKLYGRPIQDTLPAHRRSFAPEWQRSAIDAEQMAANTLAQSESYYNTHTQDLADIQLGSTVALQNPRTKLWDIYGTIVNISPYRRYSVKTQSGRILIRNRRFLRHRIPASLCASVRNPPQLNTSQHPSEAPTIHTNNELSPHPLASQTPPQELRRSDRPHRPPQRLIEDPTWP